MWLENLLKNYKIVISPLEESLNIPGTLRASLEMLKDDEIGLILKDKFNSVLQKDQLYKLAYL